MDISIHAPAKGATIAQINFFIPIYISIHAPAKGATRLRHTLRGSKRISIHAPAKGATSVSAILTRGSAFQSTLPRRERRAEPVRRAFAAHFNPRSREGSDFLQRFVSGAPAISIHAPAKGATGSLPGRAAGRGYLNPRSREGSDAILVAISSIITHFNPRSREGSDAQIYYTIVTVNISIHAPAKGATSGSSRSCASKYISIHAPAKGATKRRKSINLDRYFNPRSREGSDTSTQAQRSRIRGFQSTLPRRERLWQYVQKMPQQDFNPRSREGSDSKNHQDYSR